MQNAPRTIKELMEGDKWVGILNLFKRNNVCLDLSISPEAMGRFSKVILSGDGFQVMTDKGGLQAAFSGSRPSFCPLESAEEVVEAATDFDESVEEADLIAAIAQKVHELST